jgi:hypothetical protein
MALSISTIVSSRDSISAQGDSRGLIWLEGRYQGQYLNLYQRIMTIYIGISAHLLSLDQKLMSNPFENTVICINISSLFMLLLTEIMYNQCII